MSIKTIAERKCTLHTFENLKRQIEREGKWRKGEVTARFSQ